MSARYTVLLRTLMMSPDVKIEIDRAMSTYPIYVPANEMRYALIPTREELNAKILNHFKYREIGFETVGRFIDELEITLNAIMPKYYSLYKSVDMMNEIEDIFGNIDITESYQESSVNSNQSQTNSNATNDTTTNINASSKETDESNASSNRSNNSNIKEVYSDTPQSQLQITANDIDNIDYASHVSWNKGNDSEEETNNANQERSVDSESDEVSNTKSSSSASAESQGNTEVQHTLHRKGNQGVNTYAHDLLEFRKLLDNVEQMILNDEELNKLFMLVY